MASRWRIHARAMPLLLVEAAAVAFLLWRPGRLSLVVFLLVTALALIDLLRGRHLRQLRLEQHVTILDGRGQHATIRTTRHFHTRASGLDRIHLPAEGGPGVTIISCDLGRIVAQEQEGAAAYVTILLDAPIPRDGRFAATLETRATGHFTDPDGEVQAAAMEIPGALTVTLPPEKAPTDIRARREGPEGTTELPVTTSDEGRTFGVAWDTPRGPHNIRLTWRWTPDAPQARPFQMQDPAPPRPA